MAETNLFSDLSRMIDQIGKDKGIDKQLIIDAVTQAMLMAARKKYGGYRDIEAQYNEETGEVELFEYKEVVEAEKFIDEEVEIKFEDAKVLDPDATLGDMIGIQLESKDLGRIAAQTARQIITQKIRDAERDIIFAEFESRKGEIASGIIRRVERGSIVVDLGRTEAFIPVRDQIPGEQYKPGDRVQGYISDVRQTTKGPQIIMSRADERYLVKLFEMEVPEIAEGTVEILAVAREPGSRAKIGVVSKDPAVEPIGACVGMKGSRVQNIVQELKGEKIDIIHWDEDVTTFACNALAPAKVARVFIDENSREMEVVVPDHQLSLAIGKKGQNVRLAAKLTQWKIDIISESSLAARNTEALGNLKLVSSITDTMAQALLQYGYTNFQQVAQAEVDDLRQVPGMEEVERAEKIIQDCKTLVKQYEAEGKPIPTVSTGRGDRVAQGDAKSQAEQRLKEELAQLNKGTSQEGSTVTASDEGSQG